MSEQVLVIGAGIAGLCAALSLAPGGRDLTLLERDPGPPGENLDHAFSDWRRTGVGHLRHSHAFLARLRAILKRDHPALLSDLLASGVREFPFTGSLSEQQRKRYQADPSDADLTIITSRRTTLELVMRRYVDALPNVRIRSGFMVRRLLTEKTPDSVIRVLGAANDEEELRASIVVDASGRIGGALDDLVAQGARVRDESESAGILYFTRHYRLLPGQAEPERLGNPPTTGDLGFLKFGVFPADNGWFSITLAVPEIELEMRKAVVDPAIFQRIAQTLPGTRLWTDPDRAEPMSKVHGMGDLTSRWRDLAPDGEPAALNYFAIGDARVRTNPLYGRGCSFAAVGAELLRETLDAQSDPAARLLAYERAVQAELHPYYIAMLKQDRAAVRRSRQALTPSHPPSFRGRLLKSFIEDGIGIALRGDVRLLREAMRGFHMLEHPDAWLKRPGNLLRILGYWARGKKRNAALYPPKPGPERVAMMTALGLDAGADIVRAAA